MKNKTLLRKLRRLDNKCSGYFRIEPLFDDHNRLPKNVRDTARNIKKDLGNLLKEGNKRIVSEGIAPIIDSYQDHPVIKEVLGSGRSITDMIQPILDRANEVEKRYCSEKYHIKWFRPSEVLEGHETKIEEFKDIINLRKFYTKRLVAHPETFKKIFDYMAGSDHKGLGVYRNLFILAGTGFTTGVYLGVYLASRAGDYPISARIGAGVFYGLLGSIMSALLQIPSSLGNYPTPNNVIGGSTRYLTKEVKFIDEVLRDYKVFKESGDKSKWINTFVRGPKPSRDGLTELNNLRSSTPSF